MRVAILWTLMMIGVGVFVVMLASVWRHHAHATTPVGKVVVEYIWAMIPCLIVALCAAPAVQHVLVDLNK